jgi:hypothetical protein
MVLKRTAVNFTVFGNPSTRKGTVRRKEMRQGHKRGRTEKDKMDKKPSGHMMEAVEVVEVEEEEF